MPAYVSDGFEPPAPIARVEVVGPSRRRADVPMLLDSGADTSIVARRVAEAEASWPRLVAGQGSRREPARGPSALEGR